MFYEMQLTLELGIKGKTLVLLDCSGSHHVTYEKMMHIIEGLGVQPKDHLNTDFAVFTTQIDALVKSVILTPFILKQTLQKSFAGGTDFDAVLTETRLQGYDNAIVITDGCAPNPCESNFKGLNVIWVLTDEPSKYTETLPGRKVYIMDLDEKDTNF